MWFISLVFKNVWRRKVRSVLTCISMAVAVCAVLSMLGTAEGYENRSRHLYDVRGTDLVVTQAGKAQCSNSKLERRTRSKDQKAFPESAMSRGPLSTWPCSSRKLRLSISSASTRAACSWKNQAQARAAS